MGDHLPGRSRNEGAGRPLTPLQFRKRELARRALEVWLQTTSYTQVKNALGLRDKDVAREMVKEGERIWLDEEAGSMTRYKKMMRDDLLEMRLLLKEAVRTEDGEPRLEVIDRAVKVGERMSKLLALDEEKEEKSSGPQFVVIETRRPDERGEVIEGSWDTGGDVEVAEIASHDDQKPSEEG